MKDNNRHYELYKMLNEAIEKGIEDKDLGSFTRGLINALHYNEKQEEGK